MQYDMLLTMLHKSMEISLVHSKLIVVNNRGNNNHRY